MSFAGSMEAASPRMALQASCKKYVYVEDSIAWRTRFLPESQKAKFVEESQEAKLDFYRKAKFVEDSKARGGLEKNRKTKKFGISKRSSVTRAPY